MTNAVLSHERLLNSSVLNVPITVFFSFFYLICSNLAVAEQRAMAAVYVLAVLLGESASDLIEIDEHAVICTFKNACCYTCFGLC